MRVKLRPDAHLAPVSRGLYCSQAGRSFVLAGPRALYDAVDARLRELSAGTDLDHLVAQSGGESSRPVWQHVLGTLVERGVLLDLDSVTEPPPPSDVADCYRDVLAWLESTDPDPYAAFARLRAATVSVVGEGPAVGSLRRSLLRYGVGQVLTAATLDDVAEGSLVVVVGGEGAVVGAPPGTLAVSTAADHAVVGPVGHALTHLIPRVASAVAADPMLAAPAPVSAVLAGSIVAHTVLQQIAGRPVVAHAVVVHGREIETDTVPLPSPHAGDTRARVRLDPDIESLEVPDPAEAQRRANSIAARWTGLLRWGTDLDLPQLPFALVSASGSDVGGRVITGYGLNRAAAAVNAALSVLRSTHGAAGLTPTRWLLDGGLRRLTVTTMARDADLGLGWDDVANADTRSVWNLLHEYFDCSVQVHVRRVEQFTWPLVTVTDHRTGELLAGQWGASIEHGARLALVAAASAAQLQAATGSAATLDLFGTAALETASGRAVRVAAAEIGAVAGERVTWDPVLGASELVWGPTWPA